MDQIARRILADNITRMISRGGDPVRGKVSGWAKSNRLPQKQIDRIIKQEVSATLDTLDEIAAAIGCQPWQLLVPNMRLDELPMLVMGQSERELYERIKKLLSESGKEK